MTTSFPRLWARTRRFTLGEPRSIDVIDRRDDGSVRVLFLRSLAGDDPRTGVWVLDVPVDGDPAERLLVDPSTAGETLTDAERARRERARETAEGAVGFSRDDSGRWVFTQLGGRGVLVDADTGEARDLPVPVDAYDARLDPTGRRVGYVLDGGLHVLDIASGESSRVAGERADDRDGAIYWGRAEHAAAEEMGRLRGWWWAPDGAGLLVTRVDESELALWWLADPAHPAAAPRTVHFPAAGGPNAAVSLWRVQLGGSGWSDPVPVRWDAAGFEYLADVRWDYLDEPVVTVQSRDQRRVQWRDVGGDGGTRLLAEDTGDPWVELHPGAGALLGGELVRIADVGGRRRLLIGERPVSPPELHVRSIAGVQGAGVVITASAEDPGSIGIWSVTAEGKATAIAAEPGGHTVAVGSGCLVVGHQPMDVTGRSWQLLLPDRAPVALASRALVPPMQPAPDLFTTPSGVRVGMLLPPVSTDAPLPVLMYPYAGPHAQRVTGNGRDWLESQWWAEQGFAVIVADGHGTPGVSPAWEHAVHHDIADVVLADQVEALSVAAERAAGSGARLDLSRVGIRGWSFGGFLAAMAVLRRPDVFHAAVAGAPPTDWRLYDTHYTERYLGTDLTAAPYQKCSLLDDAPSLSRPLLLVHGMADDNVIVANTLQLSQRLTEAGRAHCVLPLSGVTHMTPQESVAENLLLLQRDFLVSALTRD